MYYLKGIVLSDEGKRRNNNEDNFNLFGSYRQDNKVNKSELSKTCELGVGYAAVYDGMGGEAAGEVASLIAAATLNPCKVDKVRTAGLQQILKANEIVCEETQKNGSRRMGTTVTALYFEKDKVICANVGDSRAYYLHNNSFLQLSKDHSEGQRMIDAGMMTLEEAKKSKAWHQLTQHLGVFPEEFIIEPHFSEVITLREGDIFLLCSDGLTDDCSDKELKEILLAGGSLKSKARALLNMALERGGKDNTTVLLLEVKTNSPLRQKAMAIYKKIVKE